MSTQADMLLNKAKAAFDEAHNFRQQIATVEAAEKVNIENALEQAQQEDQADKPDQGQYWRERADLLRDELQAKIDDLKHHADQKHQEGESYKRDAQGEIEKEKDDEQKRRMLHIMSRLMED